jgi:pantetheine-phosphate adenylyltransferase
MKAILALSADPITYGHIDVIKRALEIFSPLIVAIGVNPDKRYTFSLKKREELAKKALQGLNVEVVSFSGLLVDFAKLNCIKTIVRSVRDAADFNYEKMLHDINASQKQGIDTVLFFARQALTHISSSAVKELQKNHGSIIEYVPLAVKDALERQISGQKLIGVTGEIGAGKSFVTVELGKIHPITNIDMDVLGRKILTEYYEPLFLETRAKLVDKIGSGILESTESLKINPKKLTTRMFQDVNALAHFNELMLEPTLVAFRRELAGKSGTIFVNSALLVESDLGYLTNNNTLLIKAKMDVRIKRLDHRGYSAEEIKARIKSQLDSDKKFAALNHEIKRTSYGKIVIFDNTDPTATDFEKLALELNKSFELWE